MYIVLIVLITHLFSSEIFKGQIIDSYENPIHDVNVSLYNKLTATRGNPISAADFI